MKLLLLMTLTFFTFSSFAKEQKSTLSVPHEKMKFTYKSYDGQVILPCKHTEINEWNDWEVYCGNNREKVYAVHLVLSRYQRDVVPKNSYELLYWLTDRSDPVIRKGYGSTFWIHLREASDFYKFQASVSVENDIAGLYLTIDQY